MLVATRDLKCFGRLVRKGEPIPSPEKWSPVALASNINIGWIKDVNEPLSPIDAVEEMAVTPKIISSSNACSTCGRAFKSKRALSVHSRSHR